MNIVILGATSGIAEEVARLYARSKAKICLVGRSAERLETVSQALRVEGAAECVELVADLQSSEVAIASVTKCFFTLGRIDVCVLAQGVLGSVDLQETDPALAAQLLDLNTTSVIAASLAAAAHLRLQGAGTLVILGSVAGDRGRQANYVYGASKAALDVFAEGLRARLRPCGANVLLVKPGPVKTSMTRGMVGFERFAPPSVVANHIVSAVKHRRRVIYSPRYWKFIMIIVRMIPAALLERLRF